MESNNEYLKQLVKYIVLNYVNNGYRVCSAYNNNIQFKYKDITIIISFYPYYNPEIDYCDIKSDNFTFENISEEKNTLCIRIFSNNESTRDMKVVLSPVEYAMVCEEATKLAHSFETRMINLALCANEDNNINDIEDLPE